VVEVSSREDISGAFALIAGGEAGVFAGEACGVGVELLVAELGWAAGAGAAVCCAAIAMPDSASISNVNTTALQSGLIAASSFQKATRRWQILSAMRNKRQGRTA